MKPDALTWLSIVTLGVWLVSVVRLHVWMEIHHAWFGIPALSPEVAMWIRVVCYIILLDDACQHAIQWLSNRPSFRSPLHKLAAVLHII